MNADEVFKITGMIFWGFVVIVIIACLLGLMYAFYLELRYRRQLPVWLARVKENEQKVLAGKICAYMKKDGLFYLFEMPEQPTKELIDQWEHDAVSQWHNKLCNYALDNAVLAADQWQVKSLIPVSGSHQGKKRFEIQENQLYPMKGFELFIGEQNEISPKLAHLTPLLTQPIK